ncbi:hypothetical protein IE53DRAFT_146968 [Violaceomyces palustris]|uniref:Uncharacterized protein n=1 Tax=Violaceomyces palustris TaxID=1673888 RepID=A0ACD0NU78_9BASI|nr:hypothetical protein IE53DRAFT_146968 [Violaceomyces palustris]
MNPTQQDPLPSLVFRGGRRTPQTPIITFNPSSTNPHIHPRKQPILSSMTDSKQPPTSSGSSQQDPTNPVETSSKHEPTATKSKPAPKTWPPPQDPPQPTTLADKAAGGAVKGQNRLPFVPGAES